MLNILNAVNIDKYLKVTKKRHKTLIQYLFFIFYFKYIFENYIKKII